MSSGRVGKAIVLTCFFTAGYGRHRKLGVGFRTAGYGRHRSQWVNEHQYKTMSSQMFLTIYVQGQVLYFFFVVDAMFYKQVAAG